MLDATPPATLATLAVPCGKGTYTVGIGTGQTAAALAAVRTALAHHRRVFAVTAPAIFAANPAFFAALRETGAVLHILSRDGETAKRTGELERLWEALATGGVDRSGLVLAVGGGVVGDLAGFAAASYLRGVGLVQIPTTLLAMVDSAVGGKTGINLAAGKNLAGAFWPPEAVFADTAWLATLPPREFAAGMAEVVKYALIVKRAGDTAFADLLRDAGPLHWRHPALPDVIRECCAIKAAIVGADERETAADGGRALLNLGHTFGHAIENVAGYGEYLHGEAVAIGVVLAARLSVALGYLDEAEIAPILHLYRTNNLPDTLRSPLPVDALMGAMLRDKKASSGAIKFVLLDRERGAFTQPLGDLSLPRSLWQTAGCTA
ncbi:MAG: 3-dehydroquinate synthase [Puniceicoccales bacterium]|jgi:3-dehydroquinate synthase|nr:3-dehydroquinate synthase [Puniceicoccales bacterium]